MLNDFTLSRLQENLNNQFDGIFQRFWWFQEVAPALCLRAVRLRLHEIFANHVVTLYREVEWPPRSSDMTPCNFFLWGFLKLKVFVTPPHDM